MIFVNNSAATENQARGEIVNNLENNMFVEAGAGAGKTFLIVSRIVNMLKNGYAPGEIVVITFTNAAAEELRGRISREVKKAGLTDAIAHLDEMVISTIHSFCNVMLKEQAVAAGLPLNIQMMDEVENDKYLSKALSHYLSNLSSDDWDNLSGSGDEKHERKDIRKAIYSISTGLLGQPDGTNIVNATMHSVLDNIKSAAPSQDIIDIATESEKNMLMLANLLLDKDNQKANLSDILAIDKFINGRGKAKAIISAMIAADYPVLIPLLFDEAHKASSIFAKGGVAKDFKDKVEIANAAWGEAISNVMQSITSLPGFAGKEKFSAIEEECWRRDLTDHSIGVANLYSKELPITMVSNDSLLNLAKKLICNDADNSAHKYFAGKYRSFFVDEFQDTDSVQASFIYRLATDPDDSTHQKLRDGALFVVGDPKQSIYRFRGAQPEIYFDIKDKMSGLSNAVVYELHNNFRTNEKLIGWINDKFEEADGGRGNTDIKNIMPIVNAAHPYVPMAPVKKVASEKNISENGKLLAGAYRYECADGFSHIVDGDGCVTCEMKGASYDIADDVADVVKLVKNLIGNYMITDYDGGAPYARLITASDILIITPTMSSMQLYLEALKNAGIAVRFSGKESLAGDTLLITYFRIFSHLMNPKEPFARMGAIEALRANGIALSEADIDAYADYILDTLRDAVKGMSPYGVAEFLEKQISVLAEKDKRLSAVEINASLSHIRQMIEKVFAGGSGTGIKVAEAMDEFINGNIEYELSLTESPDSVRIMNLHKTKGLEGKIVIMAARSSSGWSTQSSGCRIGDDYYPGYSINWNSSWSTLHSSPKMADFIAESKAEFHRLEYVAVTRAEQAVIFMNTIKAGGYFASRKVDQRINTELTEGFDYKLRELPSIAEIIHPDPADPNAINAAAGSVQPAVSTPASVPAAYNAAGDSYLAARGKAIDSRHAAIYEKQSPSLLEVAESSRKVKQAARKASEEAGLTRGDELSKTLKRPADNIVGNVLHRTMELMLERFASDSDALAALCTRQAVDENKADLEIKEKGCIYTAEDVSLFVEACAKSYRRWINASGLLNGCEKVYTELPFSFYEASGSSSASGKAAPDIFMKGNADLIIKYKDGSVTLIDYKSDVDYLISEADMPAVLEEKYLPQLRVYVKTIERLLGVTADKVKVEIISFSQKDEQGKLLEGRDVRVRCTEIKVK